MRKATRGRGTLRIYLGAAPGVGKTYAMLNEGRRLKAEGRDVVVGFVETHGRAETEAQVGDLEIVPLLQVPYRGITVEEMDTEAIIARRPEIALIDELAHTNVPGSPRPKRHEDVALAVTATGTLDGLPSGRREVYDRHVQLVEDLGATLVIVEGETVTEAVVAAMAEQRATVLVVGYQPRTARKRAFSASLIDDVLARVDGLDCYLVRP